MKLVAEGLACSRGGRVVFRDVSFALSTGESLLLTGPNGAGKTSLLRLVAGLVEAMAGTIRLEGGDAELTVGQHAHFIGHLDAVKGALTAAENVDFWRAYLGGAGSGDALDAFGLADLADIPAGFLSAGQKRRLALCRLAVVPRVLWLLDEPSVSLDAQSRDTLAALVSGHVAGGGIVIASTHGDLGVPFTSTLALAGRGANS
jgi:heme exporter protein A